MATAILITSNLLPAAARADDRAGALDAAARDQCSSRIAAHGKTGNHGGGETLAFKAALLERLVGRCGFSAVFFESGSYDFAELDRLGGLTRDDRRALTASAIGRLWTLDREFDPVLDVLSARAVGGGVRLAGLDGCIGSAGAFYSIDRMPEDFVRHLPEPDRRACREGFRRRIHQDYAKDRPYAPGEQALFLYCKGRIVAGDRPPDPVRHQMLRNFRSTVAADFGGWAAVRQARGAAMFDGFRWHVRRLKPRAKVIVWTATGHGARPTAMDSRWRFVDDFGARLSRAYGRDVFVLNFAAAGGLVRWGGPVKAVTPAPAGSLEAVVLGDRRAVAYVGPATLARLGTWSAALFMPDSRVTERWRDAVDGVVALRKQRPPVRRLP